VFAFSLGSLKQTSVRFLSLAGLILTFLPFQSVMNAQSYVFPAGTTAGSHNAPVTLTVVSVLGGTVDSVHVTTQGLAGYDFVDAGGGTCAHGVVLAPNGNCTVKVKFNPITPGMRQGAIQLRAADNSVIATQYLTGVASGGMLAWNPGLTSTVAGDGTWIYRGDGTLATASTLYVPMGVVVDAAGNIYISDTLSNRIRKVDGTSGIISTIAGNGNAGLTGDGGLATSATLSNPTALALDGAGNLYFADNYNNAIRVIDLTTGKISRVAGNGTPGYSGDNSNALSAELNEPNGLAIDAAAGVLYIADTGNNVVRKLDLHDKTITTFAGTGDGGYGGDGGAPAAALLSGPWGLALSSTGTLCIADQNNHAIR